MTHDERNARVTALLHSPLGILVVLRSIEEGRSRLDELSAERLYELVVECVVDLSPYASDYSERVHALLVRGPSLRHYAEQLLNAPGTANWFANLDRRQQVWISLDGHPPPGPDAFRLDLRPFGGGVPKPRRTLWTSTSVGSYPSGWIPYLRRGEDGRPPPYHPWRLEVLPIATVYEIHGPEAWQALWLAYSDWWAVAQVWDGVHLSVGGLLTVQDVSRGEPGVWTHLFAWDVECTMWLRWVFGHVERLPDVD